ncbi:MAG: tRNA lysidine(34) synthetase TilS [Bacteroidaceae bacterium]|nr:tRNA lysidine(34) synthetase TilS [Bacteroidaceae bacterium]
MKYKIEKYIEKHQLMEKESPVLVALSGGADSVALLLVLHNLGYKCQAIHCNFHLRGEESNRDEEFVTSLCKRLGIALEIVHFDTTEYAKSHGISIEMAARELRYDAFEKQRKLIDAQAIAVAHHRDDSAETLLLNLVRGTGIRGLRGIQPKNEYIIRPLLCVGREDIIDYLKWRGQDFVTDSTNLTSDYTRNKIRLEIIPKLAEINPSIKESLAGTAQRVSEAELIYRHTIREAVKRVKTENSIDIELLKKEIAPATLLHEILSPLGFNSKQTEDIYDSLDNEGSKIFSTTEWNVVKDRNSLIITPKDEIKAIDTILPATGTVETTLGTLSIKQFPFNNHIPKQRNTACLDIEKLQLPLTLRNIQNGDRFAPFGMRGTKLISDYLTDRKKSLIEKQAQLVVTDAKGEIVWLVNERPSARCCITEKTKNVICLEWNQL